MEENDQTLAFTGIPGPNISNSDIPQRFNIRVYGLLVWNDQLLVSDEYIRGNYFTKFPGGGLEFGEGTRDCLRREFMEETGLEVVVRDHLYTTDFFQISAFNHKDQIISIYYFVEAPNAGNLATKTAVFDFEPHQVADPKGESEVFRWIPLSEIKPECVSLPIDKHVVILLQQYYRLPRQE
ncbi:NUDIX domain-containing protein [Segetibacter sp. 3557_3]|uniref:NUDIX domain-containing protein n=1 Tax=Segetibacter sp. 3557_3 TaxID=2547429 RepID=UPI0010586942|nr:NUDIX domain-containing protein [Segetibacter sp. 3557_3]TDH28849.1 NUDIX domain-containing protein [Segetibacter sp. 3557_3]